MTAKGSSLTLRRRLGIDMIVKDRFEGKRVIFWKPGDDREFGPGEYGIGRFECDLRDPCIGYGLHYVDCVQRRFYLIPKEPQNFGMDENRSDIFYKNMVVPSTLDPDGFLSDKFLEAAFNVYEELKDQASGVNQKEEVLKPIKKGNKARIEEAKP